MPTRGEAAQFGVLLRQYRVAVGLTQERLAERAGLSARGISDLERGLSRAPRLDTLARLAEALGLEGTARQAFASAAGYPPVDDPVEAPVAGPPSVALAPLHNTLPGYLTALLGRDREKAAIEQLLRRSDVRLLTLSGPGGVGKTRLAVQVAAGLSDLFPDGVVFVALAPLEDPALVLPTVAQAVGVRETSTSVLDSLAVALHGRRLLLVLDNCEHVLGATPLLADLLGRCPDLRAIATSRTRLRVLGEHTFAVRPMAVPDSVPSPEAALGWPAVALFVERAQAVQRDFVLNDDNVDAVVTVCRRLDGLPLALELAAAWVAVAPPAALLDLGELRLPFLSDGARDAPVRHQTLRHTIGWSYELLTPEQQALFRRLAVFAGGATLEAIGSVCAMAPDLELLRAVGSLVERSLVELAPGDIAPRFGMLETIREFARERVRTMGEEAEVRNRHLAFFMALAETAERSLHGPDQTAWADRIEREHDNLRVALNWSLRSAAPVQGLRLATSLYRFWYMLPSRRGPGLGAHQREARDQLRAAVTRAEGLATSETHGWGLSVLGLVESLLGEYHAASSHLEEALTIGRQQGTPSLVAFALRYLGGIANAQGDHARAQVEFEESLALYHELGAENDTAILLMYLGDTALYQGEPERARALLEESRVRLLRLQNTNVLTYPLRRLGHVALLQGDAERACQLCLESLEINRRLGDLQGVAACLVGLAAVAELDQPERSARVLGAAHALQAPLGSQLFPFDRQQMQHTQTRLRAQLGATDYAAAFAEGQLLNVDEATAQATAQPLRSFESKSPGVRNDHLERVSR